MKDVARLAAAARLERRARLSAGVRGAAFVLHAVAPRAGDQAQELNPAISTGALERLVRYLGRRYALVGAAELVPAARRRGPGEPIPVALTFDDDLLSHLEHAAPVLESRGAVATAFLCGAWRPFWWQTLQAAADAGALADARLPGIPAELVAGARARVPHALSRLAKAIEELPPDERAEVARELERTAPPPPPPLGPEGAAALREKGWEIGFHTLRHDILRALDDRQLEAALREGREQLPATPRTLAYPHGKAGAREAAAARAAGYEAAFTGADAVLTEATDTHLIGRLQPRPGPVGRVALQLARALAGAASPTTAGVSG